MGTEAHANGHGRLDGRVAIVTGAGQGTGEDIADAVAFLVSDDARYVNAHALVVDGGLTATNL